MNLRTLSLFIVCISIACVTVSLQERVRCVVRGFDQSELSQSVREYAKSGGNITVVSFDRYDGSSSNKHNSSSSIDADDIVDLEDCDFVYAEDGVEYDAEYVMDDQAEMLKLAETFTTDKTHSDLYKLLSISDPEAMIQYCAKINNGTTTMSDLFTTGNLWFAFVTKVLCQFASGAKVEEVEVEGSNTNRLYDRSVGEGGSGRRRKTVRKLVAREKRKYKYFDAGQFVETFSISRLIGGISGVSTVAKWSSMLHIPVSIVSSSIATPSGTFSAVSHLGSVSNRYTHISKLYDISTSQIDQNNKEGNARRPLLNATTSYMSLVNPETGVPLYHESPEAFGEYLNHRIHVALGIMSHEIISGFKSRPLISKLVPAIGGVVQRQGEFWSLLSKRMQTVYARHGEIANRIERTLHGVILSGGTRDHRVVNDNVPSPNVHMNKLGSIVSDRVISGEWAKRVRYSVENLHMPHKLDKYFESHDYVSREGLLGSGVFRVSPKETLLRMHIFMSDGGSSLNRINPADNRKKLWWFKLEYDQQQLDDLGMTEDDFRPFEGNAPHENSMFDVLSLRDEFTGAKSWVDWVLVNSNETMITCDFPFPYWPSSVYNCKPTKFYPVPKVVFNVGFDYRNPHCDRDYSSVSDQLKGFWYLFTNALLWRLVRWAPSLRILLQYFMYDVNSGELRPNLIYCIPTKFYLLQTAAYIFGFCLILLEIFLSAYGLVIREMKERSQERRQRTVEVQLQTTRSDLDKTRGAIDEFSGNAIRELQMLSGNYQTLSMKVNATQDNVSRLTKFINGFARTNSL